VLARVCSSGVQIDPVKLDMITVRDVGVICTSDEENSSALENRSE